MVRVTIDDAFRAQLGDTEAPIELCDQSGRVVGHFIPAQDPSIYEGTESPVGSEEIARRLREESERPLEDILHDLERRQ